MHPLTRVIGIGQPAAGDDAVGFAVIRAMQQQTLPASVELRQAASPLDCIHLLENIRRAFLVDAVVGGPSPGRVLELSEHELRNDRCRLLSSHGTNLLQVLELARVLDPQARQTEIRIIGICINVPAAPACELSAAVSQAIPVAVSMILRKLRN